MGKLIPEKTKKKYKVKDIKSRGQGSLTTLISPDRSKEISYFESSGYLYFVGVTQPRIRLKSQTAKNLIKAKYNITL